MRAENTEMKFLHFHTFTRQTLLWIGISILLVSNILSIVRLKQMGAPADAVDRYPLVDPARNKIDQQHFFVDFPALKQQLDARIKQEKGVKIALEFEYLNTGSNIFFNQDMRVYPASLVKLPVAVAAAKQVEIGEWQWESELVLFAQDVDSRYGSIGTLPLGSRLTIEKLVKAILIDSDNTAYYMLLRNLGAAKVNDFLKSTGLDSLYDEHLNITVREYGRLIRTLYTSSYLNRASSQMLLSWLGSAERVYIGAAIPKEVPFVGKFGINIDEHVYASSGIVYVPNRPYILTVVYQSDGTETDAQVKEFFKSVSDMIFLYVRDHP